MSNSKQNQKELKKQGGIDNSNNNKSFIQNIFAIEKEKKGGFLEQATITNILKQNQLDDVKKDEVAVNISNVTQKEKHFYQKKDLNKKEQIEKVPSGIKAVNSSSETVVNDKTNPIESSRKCPCSDCCDNCNCKCGSCFMTLFAIFNIIINITVIVLISNISSWTEKDPLTYLSLKSELFDTLEVKTETLSTTISLEKIDYK